MTTALTSKQKNTVLAALRYWQRELVEDSQFTFGSEFNEVKPMTAEEIDELCVSINLSPTDDYDEPCVCEDCGSERVTVDAFVDINDPTRVTTYEGKYFCEDCQQETKTRLLSEWKNTQRRTKGRKAAPKRLNTKAKA